MRPYTAAEMCIRDSNNQELCRFNLSENYDNMTAMIFGEVYRNNGEWKFNAIGQATTCLLYTSRFSAPLL